MKFLSSAIEFGNLYDQAAAKMWVVAAIVAGAMGIRLTEDEIFELAELLTDGLDETTVFGLAEMGKLEDGDPHMKVAVAHAERRLATKYWESGGL